MTDPIPTFRRFFTSSAETAARFSWKNSMVARGGLWTIIYSVPAAILYLLSSIDVDPFGYSTNNSAGSAIVFLFVFPGGPVFGFVAACCLAGRPTGILDAARQGAKAVAVLTGALLVFAGVWLFSPGEGPLAGAIMFWVAVVCLVAGVFGGLVRLAYGKLSPAEVKPMIEGAGVPAPEPVPAAGDILWLEAVSSGLRSAGLFDYATARSFHKRLQSSGQIPQGTKPPLEEKYREACARTLQLCHGKTEQDWLAANEQLCRAILFARRATGGAAASSTAILAKEYPGFSEEFYSWLLDCSRRLP